MATTHVRTAADGDADDIIQMLDQPGSTGLCSETTTIKGRRVPTCALIMLSVVGAVGLLAFSIWPNRDDDPESWTTRTIALPHGSGTVYHRDRMVDSFFGTYERRIDIEGKLNSGTVWLPVSRQAHSTRADFIWRASGSPDAAMGPWLEINDMAEDYLIDMEEIVLYRMHRIDGHVCVVALGTAAGAGKSVAGPACATVKSDDGPAIDISEWARNWTTEHLGMLDRRPHFVPGESAHSSIRGNNPIKGKPLALGNSSAARQKPCAPPIGHHILRGPPRLEYIGVVSGPSGPPCHGQPTSPRN